MTSISFSGKAPGRSGAVPGHADDHDPAGRGHHLDGLRQHAGLAAGLDHQRRALAVGPLSDWFFQCLGCPGRALGAQSFGQIPAVRYQGDRGYPRARGGCGETAARPIGPAPNTTACSPGSSLPRARACTAIEAGSTKAVRRDPDRRPRTRHAGTSSRCCRPPSRCTPTRRNRGHTLGRPARQGNSCRRAAAARWRPGCPG